MRENKNEMAKKFIFILVTLLVGIASGFAQSADGAKIPLDKNVKVGRLPNGLTYYLRRNNWPENRVCFYLAQHVGSLEEEESQRGLAHFLEHMCFNGSEHFHGDAIQKYCQSLGVDNGGGINAFTSLEETVYNIDNVPSSVGQERLDSCLLILYDWANALKLDSVEIEKERGVIHEEWRMRSNAQMRILNRQLPVVYPDCKYGVRMPIGLMSVVDSFSHKELRDYYEKWYNPENQCVVVVGDIDVDHTEAQIRKLFSGIEPKPGAGKVVSVEVPDTKGIIFSIDRDPELQQNSLQVMFKHKCRSREQKQLVSTLADDYLTGAATGMLNMRYGDEALKEGCPYMGASASDGPYIFSTTKDAFSLNCRMKDGMQCQALTAVIRECRRAAQYGFTEEEYNRYRTEYQSQLDAMLLNADKRSSSSLVSEYYGNYLDGDPYTTPEDYVAIMRKILDAATLEQISRRMAELLPLTDDNMVIADWNVEHDGATYPTEEELAAALKAGREAKVEPYVDKLKGADIIAKAPKAGKIKKTEHIQALDYDRLTLSNGAVVLLKHTDIDKGQVLFEANGKGGWAKYGTQDDATIAMFNSIPFGSNNLTTSDIGKLLAGRQASAGFGMGMTDFSFNGNAVPDDVETMLKLVYADFTCPSKDADAYRKVMERTAEALHNRVTVPESAFGDSVSVLACDHNPRFRPLREEALSLVSYDRALEMLRDQTSDAGAYTFLIVGNYDEKAIRPLICRYLASLPATGRQTAARYIKSWPTHDEVCDFEREMGTPKTLMRLAWVNQKMPNTMLNRMKSELAGRVLSMVYNKTIREDAGAAYYAVARVSRQRGDGDDCLWTLTASSTLRPEMTDTVRMLMHQGLDSIQVRIDEKQFNDSRESMIKGFNEAVRTSNGYWLSAMWQLERYSNDPYTGYVGTLNSITIDDLREFVRDYMKDATYQEVVMKPKEK